MTIRGYGNSEHEFFSLQCVSDKEKLQAMPKISYPSIVSIVLIKSTFTRRGFNFLHGRGGVHHLYRAFKTCRQREIDSKQLYISNTVSATLTLLLDFTTNNIFFYIFKSFLLCVWWIISMNISSYLFFFLLDQHFCSCNNGWQQTNFFLSDWSRFEGDTYVHQMMWCA